LAVLCRHKLTSLHRVGKPDLLILPQKSLSGHLQRLTNRKLRIFVVGVEFVRCVHYRGFRYIVLSADSHLNNGTATQKKKKKILFLSPLPNSCKNRLGFIYECTSFVCNLIVRRRRFYQSFFRSLPGSEHRVPSINANATILRQCQ
jgi:hypothetical protein